MTIVTVDPDLLDRYRDTLGPVELQLIAKAGELRDVLRWHARANPDFGHDHSALAEELDRLARGSAELSARMGAVASAARSADAVRLFGVSYVPAPRLDRALERGGLQGAFDEDGLHDIRRLLVAMSERDWRLLVNGGLDCPSHWLGRYGGGGAILGPDGLTYPLVIPELFPAGGGAALPTNLSTHQLPTRDPRTLGGSDAGWQLVHRDLGLTRIGDQPGRLARGATALGFASGLDVSTLRFAEPELLGAMTIAPSGAAALQTGRTSPGSASAPGSFHVDELPRELTVWVEGELHHVDPARIDEAPRRVRRAFDQQYPDGARSAPAPRPHLPTQSTVSRATGAADLLVGGLHGVAVASELDRSNHAAYDLRFEQHPDGRRRALLTTYRAVAGDGAWEILADGAYHVDGELQLHPLHVDVASEVRPPDSISAMAGPRHARRLPPA